MKTFAELIFLALVSFTSPAAPSTPQAAPEDQDLCGYYSCAGVTASGSSYEGVVMIAPTGRSFTVTWAVAGACTRGCGLRHGEFLSVGWVAEAEGVKSNAVSVYHISHGRSLKGTWAMIPGSGKSLTEELTFLRPLLN